MSWESNQLKIQKTYTKHYLLKYVSKYAHYFIVSIDSVCDNDKNYQKIILSYLPINIRTYL